MAEGGERSDYPEHSGRILDLKDGSAAADLDYGKSGIGGAR
jgi:hypothetical protein